MEDETKVEIQSGVIDYLNKLRNLQDVSMYTLGWLMGNNCSSESIAPLANALKESGVKSSYLDEILKRNGC